jgi:hypothetical protein
VAQIAGRDHRSLLAIDGVERMGTVRENTSTTMHLLFDADHSLQERIISEQFLS